MKTNPTQFLSGIEEEEIIPNYFKMLVLPKPDKNSTKKKKEGIKKEKKASDQYSSWIKAQKFLTKY